MAEMGEQAFRWLQAYFQHHGYWTVACALLLENAGIPVPGETILLFASFLAFSEKQLHLPWIIVVGTLACAIGDNLGYSIGRRGGRPLLDRWKHFFHVKQSHIDHGERLFVRFGSFTIFFARFVFGMRVIAGPLAGVLRMPWKQFVIFNFCGAALWVSTISITGYLFGRHWRRLLHTMHDVNLVILAAAALAGGFFWLRRRRSLARQADQERNAATGK